MPLTTVKSYTVVKVHETPGVPLSVVIAVEDIANEVPAPTAPPVWIKLKSDRRT